jgi:hypothetical protein
MNMILVLLALVGAGVVAFLFGMFLGWLFE